MFGAARAGEYEFCFTNNSPIFETVALDIYFGYDKVKTDEVVKDGKPVHTLPSMAITLSSILPRAAFIFCVIFCLLLVELYSMQLLSENGVSG